MELGLDGEVVTKRFLLDRIDFELSAIYQDASPMGMERGRQSAVGPVHRPVNMKPTSREKPVDLLMFANLLMVRAVRMPHGLHYTRPQALTVCGWRELLSAGVWSACCVLCAAGYLPCTVPAPTAIVVLFGLTFAPLPPFRCRSSPCLASLVLLAGARHAEFNRNPVHQARLEARV